MSFNWQKPEWPNFHYSLEAVGTDLVEYAHKSGKISGLLSGLPTDEQVEAALQAMVVEAIKTSEIEGEYLSKEDVMSSVRNQLGLNDPIEQVRDRASEGASELMIAVRNSWEEPLSEETLFAWHRALMKGTPRVERGAWRSHEDPMQVISNPYGKPRIHFEAPPSKQVPREMTQFIDWYNESRIEIAHPPIRAAIAHLYFESIHPFEDGNGRIGRAISEKALSQGANRPILISLSAAIEAKKSDYYQALEKTQRSNEISDWIAYFVSIILIAQNQTEERIEFVLKKKRFFETHQSTLSERQLRVVNRMLAEGPSGFEGGMSARKYKALTGVSKATATRDLQDLASSGVLTPIGGGRSVRYELAL